MVTHVCRLAPSEHYEASFSPLFVLLSFLAPDGGFAAVKPGELTGVEVSASLDWLSD